MIEEDVHLGYKYIEGGTSRIQATRRIPSCRCIVVFRKTLQECKEELSTLQDWIVFGLSNDFYIPIINGIDLNKDGKMEALVNAGISLDD